MHAKMVTPVVESSKVEMPVEAEESPLLALNLAASSGILHLVSQEETPEEPELPNVVQDDNEEMTDAPQQWTTEDDEDIGMGPL
jgi:hypothetical protein